MNPNDAIVVKAGKEKKSKTAYVLKISNIDQRGEGIDSTIFWPIEVL